MSTPMTIKCDDCKTAFGGWRPRCPACGWTVPPTVRRRMLEPSERVAPAREPKPKREREKRPDECVLCRKRVKSSKTTGPNAAMTCPYCNEPIHKRCLDFHRADCLKFQLEVEALSKKRA